MNTYQLSLKHLVERAGGIVQNQFVIQPGCMIADISQPSEAMMSLMAELNIDSSQSPETQRTEFDARLTYLSFPTTPKNGGAFVESVSKQQHTSIFGRTFVTLLVAGISLETELELISHPWGNVARLTSSDTKAMDECLYRVSGEEIDSQIRALTALETILKQDEFQVLSRYIRNRLKSGAKASALTIGMTLTQWDWVLGSRLQRTGNEPEVLEIMERICAILHERFPLIIKSIATYRGEKVTP